MSCLVLFSFCAFLLHSLIMWVTVSSQSPYNLHLLFWCVTSILTLIWLVLMTLCCTAFKRDYFCFLTFPFVNFVHVFSGEICLVSYWKSPYTCYSFLFFCFLIISVLFILELSVLFLMAEISLPLRFSVYSLSLNRCSNAIFSSGKASQTSAWHSVQSQREIRGRKAPGFGWVTFG